MASWTAHPPRDGFGDFLAAPVLLGSLRLPYGVVAGVLLLLLGIGLSLSRSPLLGVLGYETSAIVAVAVALLLPWGLAHRLTDLRAQVEADEAGGASWASQAEGRGAGWLLAAILLASIPGAVLLLAAGIRQLIPASPFVRNCDLVGGLAWYAGITGVTTLLVFGMTAGMAAWCRHGRGVGWLTIGWVIGSIVLVLGHWILGPRVAFLHPIAGAIILPNYSPVVNQDLPFWVSRAVALHWGLLGWLLYLLAWHGSERRFSGLVAWRHDALHGWRGARQVQALLIVAGLVLSWWYRGPLGLATPMSWLRHELAGLRTTPHFRIHYDKDVASPAQLDDVELLCEFHYDAIATAFELTEPLIIDVWLYPSAAEKERLTGARGSVFAKPWINATHVFATGTDISALRHELTHIMGREFGPPPTYVNLLAGIAEGTSEAIAWDAGPDLTFHQWARGGQDLRLAGSLPVVLSNEGFFTGRVPLNYATSGSFMRYLIDSYGMARFRELFRHYNPFVPGHTRQWQQHYGKSLQELEQEWRAWLAENVPFSDRDRETVQFTYEQPAFTNQVCARVVASAQVKAQQASAFRLWDLALAQYDLLWQYQPGNLYHRFGKLDVLVQAERYDAALALYEEMLTSPQLNQGLRSRLLGVRADIALRQGDWDAAATALEAALNLAVFSWQDRDGSIKQALLGLPEEARSPLIAGLTGRAEYALFYFARAEAGIPFTSWIPSYLQSRRLSFAGEYAAAMEGHTRFLLSDGVQQALHGRTADVLGDPTIPIAVLREGLLVALHDAVWSHDLAAAAALEAWIDAGSRLQDGASVPWSPADEVRIQLYRDYAAFQRHRAVPPPAIIQAGLWSRALAPPAPVVPLEAPPAVADDRPGTASRQDASQSVPDPARE